MGFFSCKIVCVFDNSGFYSYFFVGLNQYLASGEVGAVWTNQNAHTLLSVIDVTRKDQ